LHVIALALQAERVRRSRLRRPRLEQPSRAARFARRGSRSADARLLEIEAMPHAFSIERFELSHRLGEGGLVLRVGDELLRLVDAGELIAIVDEHGAALDAQRELGAATHAALLEAYEEWESAWWARCAQASALAAREAVARIRARQLCDELELATQGRPVSGRSVERFVDAPRASKRRLELRIGDEDLALVERAGQGVVLEDANGWQAALEAPHGAELSQLHADASWWWFSACRDELEAAATALIAAPRSA
jgi:hypothetical protein